jgi:hypothetical protein
MCVRVRYRMHYHMINHTLANLMGGGVCWSGWGGPMWITVDGTIGIEYQRDVVT